MDTTVGVGYGSSDRERSWFAAYVRHAARRTDHRSGAVRRRVAAWLVDLVLGLFFPDRSGSALLPTPSEVVEAMWEQLRDGTLVAAFSVSLLRARDRLRACARRRLDRRPGDGTVPADRGDAARLRGRGAHVPLSDLGAPGRDVVRASAWYGPVLVVFIAGLPYVILNMSEGVRDVSKELRDMAAAYEVPRDRVMRTPDPSFAQPVLLRLAPLRPGERLEGTDPRRGVRGDVRRRVAHHGDARLRRLRGRRGIRDLFRAVLDRGRAARLRAAVPAGLPLEADDGAER